MASSAQRRVIIVTGSSRGLGRAIACRFGKAGERIVVNYRSHGDAAKTVLDEVIQNGGEAIPYCADISDPDEVNAMINHTIERWGAVDVLINNAAVTKDGIILRMNEKDWNTVIDTDLKGPFNCIRAAARQMIDHCDGHIINVSSIVALQGREGQANYAAAKAGLIGLTKSVANEFGPFNIKVNAVLPGYLPTDMDPPSRALFIIVFSNRMPLAEGQIMTKSRISSIIFH